MSHYSYTAVPSASQCILSTSGEENGQKKSGCASDKLDDIGATDTMLLGVKCDVPSFPDLGSLTDLEIPDDFEIPDELELCELKNEKSDSNVPYTWSCKGLTSINGKCLT